MRWVIDAIKHNVFIEMVQSGRDFCECAKISEKKTKENMSEMMIITTTGAIIAWMAVFLVIGSTIFIELLYVDQFLAFSLQSTIMLFICLVTFAFLIAYGFLGIFQTVLETIIYCYIEDLDENDGSSFKPYAMSPSLQKLMGLVPS
jgi:solute carrier family 44 protein 1 (choline transporter-like protein)